MSNYQTIVAVQSVLLHFNWSRSAIYSTPDNLGFAIQDYYLSLRGKYFQESQHIYTIVTENMSNSIKN
jgi:hypothetical protein